MKRQWDLLEQLYSEALELPPGKRLVFVKEQSGGDEWLLSELETLLQTPEAKVDAAFDSGAGIVRELLTALDSEYMVGREIGGYRIESLISSGGMGIVYKAVETATGEPVALKLLPPEDNRNRKLIRRLAREAAALRSLRHPGIVRIKEHSLEPGFPFLAMELVTGTTLQERLAGGAVPLDQALDWGLQIASAVEAAHQHGVVHRDLKPANIMIENATGRVRLLDFGLALVAGEKPSEPDRTTVEGTVAGTVAYFSPEQANGGRGDERSDIFSFGAVLYEMIAGRPAFDRPTAGATAAAVIGACPDPLPAHIPDPVGTLVFRCLEKEAVSRDTSMRLVAEEIENLRSLLRRGKLKSPLSRSTLTAAAGLLSLTVAIAAGWLISVGPPAPRFSQSIAVLPFTALGSDPASQYLSLGLTEELTEKLSRIPKLRVIAQSSARRYQGKTVLLKEVGKQLRVAHLLEGKVAREGDRFKLSARLERVSDGAILWSDSFDRPEVDLAAVQSELAETVAGILGVLAGHVAIHVPKPQAHEYLMKARYEAQQLNPASLQLAEADLQRSIGLDPEYAPAYLGLGLAKWNLLAARGSITQVDGQEREIVTRMLHKALELDPGLATARALLARMTMQYDWDWDAAERELQVAAPGRNPDIDQSYAFLRVFQGRFAEADEYLQRSQDLDPFSTALMNNFAAIRFLEGRPAEAREMALRLVATSTDVMNARLMLAGSEIMEGKTQAALREIREWPRFPGAPMYEAMAYARAGQRVKAMELIHPFEEKYPNPGVTLQWFALVYGLLGDAPNTVKWLERSAARHEWQALNLAVNPVFESVRSAPEFRALEARMGLLH